VSFRPLGKVTLETGFLVAGLTYHKYVFDIFVIFFSPKPEQSSVRSVPKNIK
jgi:hypothetical protein